MQYTLDVTGGVRLIARIGAAVVPTRTRRLALESPLASKGPLVNIEPKHRDEHRRHAHRPLRAGGLRGARAASVPVDSACPRLLVLSRAARKESSASTPPDSTSETLRPRHGVAQAPRYEGCRVLRDPHRDGELEDEHAPSDLASSHMAWNRRRGRTSECRVAVPAATKRWRGHLSHSHPSGHLTPVSRLSRPHRPDTWSAGRGGCPSCPSPPDLPAPRVAHRAPRLDHSFSAPWHDMAEDVSPAIMKHVGEHFR